jgi:hypothetical protein
MNGNTFATRAKPEDMNYVWHSDFHDGPLNGLARHDGRLCWFEYDFQADEFILTPLGGAAKIKAIARWRWFEICVGTHCSYPSGNVFTSRRGQWFWRELANLYYGKRVFKAPRKNKETRR